MGTIQVFKAQPTVRDEPVEEVVIYIETPIPSMDVTLDELSQWFDKQAERLEAALFSSLPGGTYDHLLSKMLTRKASHFIVSYKE